MASALLLTLALPFWTLGCSEPDFAEHPPHIVFILVDDLGWGDVGYHGSEIETPNIDRLARDGLALERFYASPMCTPSRAQFLTGRHAARMGLAENVHYRGSHGLPAEETTLAEILRGHGYATAMVGKWHLGHRMSEHHPNQQGFDHFYGHLNGWITYTTHVRKNKVDWQRNGETLREEGYATDLIAREAVRIIEGRDRSEPLFLYAAFNAPHAPLHVAPGRKPRKDSPRAIYATMVEALDEAIGHIVGSLQREGMLDNTLLFFASDNGADPTFGGHNGPLRGQKFQTFEGGIRTPAILHWPGHFESREPATQFVSNLDILPTLLAVAGATHPDPGVLDGRDMLASLRSGRSAGPSDFFFKVFSEKKHRSALIRPPWKLLRQPAEAKGSEPRTWLFDIVSDEFEAEDLSLTRPDLKKQLTDALDEFETGLSSASADPH